MSGDEGRKGERSGAEAVCDGLEEQGVDVVFGHPGGAILPLYDALHGRPALKHVLARHEQGAVHAADGYARATGRTGVCLATSGPGATNLVTGLATASMDSVPLVAVTGQVPSAAMGTDAFQETDVLGMTMPVTKHGILVTSTEEIPEAMREAFEVARSGRPGPVLVDLPKDLQTARLPAATPASRPGAVEAPPAEDFEEALEQAAALLNGARRPLVMVGRGVLLSGTSEEVRALAERHQLPVVTTLLGLDAFPGSHPLSLGLPGMHGTARANRAIQEADVVLGLGLRFDDRVTGPVDSFVPDGRIVLCEVDPAVVGRTVTPDVALVGDLRHTVPGLASRMEGTAGDEWWERIRSWDREADPAAVRQEDAASEAAAGSTAPVASAAPRGEAEPDPRPLTGRQVTRALARVIDREGAQVATDVGQHQMWIAQELREGSPGTHITSGGLGTMGFALPGGFGAAVGRRDRPTWVVVGDGGFQMTLQELATVVEEGVPLRIAVVNNGFLGMVRQWQELFYEGRYSASQLSGPDFPRLAEAYGIPGRAVSRRDELAETLAWAEAAEGPVLVDFRVEKEENVYPMVPPGERIDELVEAPDPTAVGNAGAPSGPSPVAGAGAKPSPATGAAGGPR